MNEIQERVLRLLATRGAMTERELPKKSHLPYREAWAAMAGLRGDGLASTDGENWYLTIHGVDALRSL